MNSEYFKPYPKYEDVFYDDIEHHKKYFLPICSVNLKFLDPKRDEWFHFISVKEIYEGCVGENTFDFHTEFTKEDMFGFDILDGKYKFDAPWDYFEINHQEETDDEREIIEYFDENRFSFENEDAFEKWISPLKCDEDLKKELRKLFKWHDNPSKQDVYEHAIKRIGFRFEDYHLDNLQNVYDENTKSFELKKAKFEENESINSADFFGFIDDIQFQSTEYKELIEKYNLDIEKLKMFEDTNLLEVPKDENGNVFEYIGELTGYSFQKYGADSVYLFHNSEMKKAVICLEYT